jgi:hypothetical protein
VKFSLAKNEAAGATHNSQNALEFFACGELVDNQKPRAGRLRQRQDRVQGGFTDLYRLDAKATDHAEEKAGADGIRRNDRSKRPNAAAFRELKRESKICQLMDRIGRQSGVQREEIADLIEELPRRAERDRLDCVLKKALGFPHFDGGIFWKFGF